MKRLMDSVLTAKLKVARPIFAEYRLLRKISDAGTNFVSEKCCEFCRSLNTHQTVSLSYNHQSSGQAEVCIHFMKCTMKKCFDTNNDVNPALLQIHSIPLNQGLLSPAALILNRPTRGLMTKLSKHLYYLIIMIFLLPDRKATKW